MDEHVIDHLFHQLEAFREMHHMTNCDRYTMGHFLHELVSHRKSSYGWRKDYVTATMMTPGAKVVSNEQIDKWRVLDSVPAWAVEQIPTLRYPPRRIIERPSRRWTERERAFVLNLKYEQTKYHIIATRCSEEFGRPITENAIKGVLDREEANTPR